MKIEELMEKLGEIGLQICYCNPHDKNVISVVKAHVANPLLFFNNLQRGAFYNGNVTFKSVNAWLFTESEIVGAIRLVDEYLKSTPTQNAQILN
ncbi:hypothetical protein ACOMCU_00325 [Lysinibacillus sp. UGB7]|uniref:hypothetical protein n=1 Tax=Lysinibacillus sp. UGB7 TaxID=3411039 RepID=UPI003B7A63E3